METARIVDRFYLSSRVPCGLTDAEVNAAAEALAHSARALYAAYLPLPPVLPGWSIDGCRVIDCGGGYEVRYMRAYCIELDAFECRLDLLLGTEEGAGLAAPSGC